MSLSMFVRVEPDRESFERVIHALDSESDGRKLRSDLVKNLNDALQPAVQEAKSAIMGAQSGGIPHAGEPLRPAIAAGVHSYVRLGKNPMVGVEASKVGMPRGFAQAPKRMNERRGWRHPVYGSSRWVTQMGAPGWFDDTMQKHKAKYEKAVQKALQAMSDRIGRRA